MIDQSALSRSTLPEVGYKLVTWCCLLLLILDAGAHVVKTVEEHCGRSNYHDEHRSAHALRKRIVGGQQSQFGEWPWLVSTITSRINMLISQRGCCPLPCSSVTS